MRGTRGRVSGRSVVSERSDPGGRQYPQDFTAGESDGPFHFNIGGVCEVSVDVHTYATQDIVGVRGRGPFWQLLSQLLATRLDVWPRIRTSI